MFKSKKDTILFIVLIGIILVLVMTNIYFIRKSYKNKNVVTNEEYVYEKVEGPYDKEKEYYIKIGYSKFKKYYKDDKVRIVAIIDNSSNTYNKYLEVVNKLAYYNGINIYLLETSKLSTKNEIDFYGLDDRFRTLKSNYIVTIRDSKILALTTFENEYLNILEKGIGE